MCVSKITIIGSNNGLSPGRRQAIIWTNDELLCIGPLGTNHSEILIGIHTFSFKKMRHYLNHCLQLAIGAVWTQSATFPLRYVYCLSYLNFGLQNNIGVILFPPNVLNKTPYHFFALSHYKIALHYQCTVLQHTKTSKWETASHGI